MGPRAALVLSMSRDLAVFAWVTFDTWQRAGFWALRNLCGVY